MKTDAMIRSPERERAVERNMDLIRKVLLIVESQAAMDGTAEFMMQADDDVFHGHSQEALDYHLRLLREAEFLTGNSHMMLSVTRLTWDGDEFLDNIKDNEIWSKTKKRLSGLPSVALSIVAQVAQSEVKKHLGLP